MNIAAPHLANLIEYASYRGLLEEDLRKFLVNSQLDICTPENSVSDTEFLNILAFISEQTDDNYLGLHYGCYLNIKALGFIATLALNTNQLEQAVFILQNYLQITVPIVSLLSEKKGGNYVLKLESNIENKTLKRHVMDLTYCFIYRELCLMIDKKFLPVLTHPNADDGEYLAFLNTTIIKDNSYSFIFKKGILHIPINQKRMKEIEFLLPKFLQLLDKQKAESSRFSFQMRNVILNMCCPELPTFEQVAVHFPWSHRSIQRKLSQEGLSFRKITDEIKCELADYLAKDRQMKTQDIASILGYSESSAFLHAVKKWKGRNEVA